MPANQMLVNLKNVSESLLGILTLLLQVLVHQIEIQPPAEEDPEHGELPVNSEMAQTMANMLQELQNQRTVLQNLVASQINSTAVRTSRPPTSQAALTNVNPTTPPVRTNQSNLPSPMMSQVIQQLAGVGSSHGAASPVGTVASWVLAEEEEVLSAEMAEPAMINVMRAPVHSSAMPASPTPVVTSQPRTVGDWGLCRVTWGKKHKGKTFLEVYQTDLGYYHWSLARFQSLPEPQKDFVRFCQVRAEMDSRSLSQG